MNSPLGRLKLVAGERGLRAILWENDKPGRVLLRTMQAVEHDEHLDQTERQLSEYFAGERIEFALELDPVGTEFQLAVWAALRTIPFGESRTYAEIASQIGNPKSVRAVGAANGRNPISIVVPCHRVIGSSGHLTGFAGGLTAKAWLLRLEQGARGPIQGELGIGNPWSIL
ncbi:methylated-DNA--[protein]-cysteine S-methyltransferase [Luteolibacter pohnpeiensis]|uniref:Methylated-DNA--protein-cysteine methyltransferase n=1 Tax=Luteolibacter pohnpeiensis TaxID=454153 RepID=A0A934SAL5_9BACT|nr:methylated-DNA--[protein]-cysteine S-methyltransferase [Luteolibacter pohnpeiensis]MBK1882384.1 methylated-DNA--[protein]-cysteine S-methyltransferase [Luteolibacter pohnpeiensis]